MRIEEIDGKWYVIKGRNRKVSEPFDTAQEADEEMTDIYSEQAEMRELYGEPEDTPCLQPEDFMSYHG